MSETPKLQKKRIYIVTMVYTNAETFRTGMQRLHETVDMSTIDAQHVLLDQHWPLDYAGTRAAVDEYLQAHPDAVLLDAGRNLGLHEGLNHLVASLDPLCDDDTIIIAADPDEAPFTAGWADAMLDVFNADPTCGWLSLVSKPITDNLNEGKVETTQVAGVSVRVPPYCLMNILCGWRMGAIRAAGIFAEPFAWYGGLEIEMQPRFRRAGYWVGWLADYESTARKDLEDAIYAAYKLHHVGFSSPVFPGSFEEWLAK